MLRRAPAVFHDKRERVTLPGCKGGIIAERHVRDRRRLEPSQRSAMIDVVVTIVAAVRMVVVIVALVPAPCSRSGRR